MIYWFVAEKKKDSGRKDSSEQDCSHERGKERAIRVGGGIGGGENYGKGFPPNLKQVLGGGFGGGRQREGGKHYPFIMEQLSVK